MFPCWYCFAWQEPWGTVLSRLPSCVISRYQRYYPAIRLPVPRLTSFLFWLCVIPRIPYEEETGSPQLTYCHCTAWLALETPREYVKSRHNDKPIYWLPHFQLRRLPGLIFDFGAKSPCSPTTYWPALSTFRYLHALQVVTDDVASILSDGISTR